MTENKSSAPEDSSAGDLAEVPLNPWQQAVDHELVTAHLGVAGTATAEEARKALNELICWHIAVATDPQVNGGFSLQPAQAEVQAEPVAWMDTNTLEAMRQTPSSAKTRWPVHRLTEWDDKTNYTPLHTAPQAQSADALDARRGVKWLTVVYRDVQPGDEAREIGSHQKVAALSWSHALDDRDLQPRKAAKPQRRRDGWSIP